jgi:hypothetical protein
MITKKEEFLKKKNLRAHMVGTRQPKVYNKTTPDIKEEAKRIFKYK